LIYKIEIENFCSVRERQILDLSISEGVADPDGRYAPLFEGSNIRAPKVVAIFGPNASGRTTILKALELVTAFVRYYPLRDAGGFPFDAFNDTDSISKPVKLAIELGGVVDLQSAGDKLQGSDSTVIADVVEYCVYRYELEFVRNSTGGYRVGRENLYQKPASASRWSRLFERDGQAIKGPKESSRFSLAGYAKILDRLPVNASVIATLAEFQHAPSIALVAASHGVITNLRFTTDAEQDVKLVSYLASAPDVLKRLNRELRQIDLGLDELRIEQTPSGPLPMFKHDGLKTELPWALESHGTRSFIRIFPLIIDALERGGVAIIDEMDGQLHPMLLPHIVEWFYHRSEHNALDAQLWFTCHSASLLHDLAKEEIVICDKDGSGRTEVYSLMDVGAVGRSDNFYRKYLSGIYGGVPQIG
jgi:energy-coupling factor transporter ATP-binding protein EcfA2